LAALAEIVASMIEAEREGQAPQRIRFLTRNALLVVDEIGYLPTAKTAPICPSNWSMPATTGAP
jgi:hypothetical protein